MLLYSLFLPFCHVYLFLASCYNVHDKKVVSLSNYLIYMYTCFLSLFNRMKNNLQQVSTSLSTVSYFISLWLMMRIVLFFLTVSSCWSSHDCNPQVSNSLPCCQDFPYRFSNENGGYAPVRPRQHQAGGVCVCLCVKVISPLDLEILNQ